MQKVLPIQQKGEIMKNLQLPLKREWFEMTDSGEKTEDYREITPYWIGRIVAGLFTEKGAVVKTTELNECDYHRVVFKRFDTTTLTLGYPKSTDTDRIIKYVHAGIEIREGRAEWGAVPGVKYFVIKHGKRLLLQKQFKTEDVSGSLCIKCKARVSAVPHPSMLCYECWKKEKQRKINGQNELFNMKRLLHFIVMLLIGSICLLAWWAVFTIILN